MQGGAAPLVEAGPQLRAEALLALSCPPWGGGAQVVRWCPPPPPPLQSTEGDKGKGKRERIIVVVRSPCQEN